MLQVLEIVTVTVLTRRPRFLLRCTTISDLTYKGRGAHSSSWPRLYRQLVEILGSSKPLFRPPNITLYFNTLTLTLLKYPTLTLNPKLKLVKKLERASWSRGPIFRPAVFTAPAPPRHDDDPGHLNMMKAQEARYLSFPNHAMATRCMAVLSTIAMSRLPEKTG